MIGVERPNTALMRKPHEPLGAGDLAQPRCIGRVLPFPDTRWQTVRSHVPDAQRAPAERFRVLRPGGQIAVSDSRYNILTMAISSADPLQSCAQAFVAIDVSDLGSWAAAAMLAPAAFTCP
jgi:hypothetical protein